ncbi:hypothetical protein TorRG33x02_021200, partial [Trema orientale]
EFVLKGLIITTVATLSLTSYTFWAAQKSKSFSYLEPLVFTGLVTLNSNLLLKEVFYPVSSMCAAFALFQLVAHAVVFSHYVLYITEVLLMTQFTVRYLLYKIEGPKEPSTHDDYIMATITLDNSLMVPVAAILTVLNMVELISNLRSCISS